MEAVGNTPVTMPKFIKALGRGTWNFLESMGKARAAAELHRQGFHKEAKNLMLENNNV